MPPPGPRAEAPSVARASFGETRDGIGVDVVTLRNASGLVVKVMTYGATIQQLLAPGLEGGLDNVVLGYSSLDEYLAGNPAYLGGTIGRYANRIAGAQFTLGGATYTLSRNDGGSSLHGGKVGFDKRVWVMRDLIATPGFAALELGYSSPAGEMGFPGTLDVVLTYALRNDDSLRIDYRATTDEPTVVNLTSHTYWNLAGEGSGVIDDHILRLHAGSYTPVDEQMLPTGAVTTVAGTPFDFTEPRAIGSQLHAASRELELAGGFDVNYVLHRPGDGSLSVAAELYEQESGRVLTVLTTEPGMQLYSGQNLGLASVAKNGSVYRARSGLALETQHFPDSPNQPSFPSTTLTPGRTFASSTVWRLSTRSPAAR
jgi:aldose 1-epimerase